MKHWRGGIDNYRELAWELGGGWTGNVIWPAVLFIAKWSIVAGLFWVFYKIIM